MGKLLCWIGWHSWGVYECDLMEKTMRIERCSRCPKVKRFLEEEESSL